MAPTICLPELSVRNNGPICYTRRNRQRNVKTSNVIIKEQQQRLELTRILNNSTNFDRVSSLSPPASPVWDPTCQNTNSFSSTRNSVSGISSLSESTNSANLNCNQRWRSILARREGLLDIVARTMALVRRSHMLQKRVNALRYETREFIRSVLNNPENNNAGKQLLDMKRRDVVQEAACGSDDNVDQDVSSSSEIISSSRPITPPSTPDSSTEYIVMTYDSEFTDDDYTSSSYSNLSNSDYSSDDSDYASRKEVNQDPMVSSS